MLTSAYTTHTVPEKEKHRTCTAKTSLPIFGRHTKEFKKEMTFINYANCKLITL